MPQGRHDWDDLERRWIAGTWKTLEEMAKDTGISIRMVQKNSASRKWKDKRQQVEDAANEEALRLMGKALGKKLAEANTRALKAAKILQEKGLSKFVNKDGTIKEDEMDSESAAITAIRAGIAIEQAILKNQELDGTPAGGSDQVNLFAIQQNNYSTGELTDEQLTAIISDADRRLRQIEPRSAAPNKKSSSKRVGGKKKSKRASA